MNRELLLLVALAASLFLVVLCGIAYGAISYPLSQVFKVLVYALVGGESTPEGLGIIVGLRLPRVLMGMLAGAALAGAGACLQGLFRNPLADPGLVGVSGGAAVGAAFAIIIGPVVMPLIYAEYSLYVLPLFAFTGALSVTMMLYGFSRMGGQVVVAYMLLTGIAINAMASVLIGLMVYLSDDGQLRDFTFWSMGSLASITWPAVKVVSLPIVVCLVLMIGLIRPLNLFQLGEQGARHLGLNIGLLKKVVVVLVAISVGACVALTGAIGFVGLVVPHLIRLMVGTDHQYVIPGALLLGPLVIVLADLIARIWVAPGELPLGLVTGAIGAPFFLWLLLQQQKRASL